MKSFSVALAAHYAGRVTTLAFCLKLERKDGEIYGVTDTDHAFDVDGVTYLPGFDMSELANSANLAVDNFEVHVTPDSADGAVTVDELLAGRWDNAKFTIFQCNHLAPGDGINILRRGTTGNAEETASGYRVEFRSLKQTLQQPLGGVTTKTCPYELGSTSRPWGLCKVDLAPWTHTYTVTDVISAHQIECADALEADEYFKEGRATGNDAANEGYSQKVKDFADGVFTLALPMPFEVNVGDEFTFIAGCQKRLMEDCKAKFNNVLNFGGEPHMPGPDLLLADPETSA